MPYVIQSEKEKEQQTSQNGEPLFQPISGPQAPLTSGQGGQQAGSGQPSSSGNFTNFQKYVQKNQGQNAPNIAGDIQAQGQTARNTFGNIKTGSQAAVENNRVAQEDKDYAQKFFRGGNQVLPTGQNAYYEGKAQDRMAPTDFTENDKNKWKGLVSKQATGPKNYLEAQTQFGNTFDTELNQYRDNSNLLNTEAGQRQLLDKKLGSTRGVGAKDLDYALFRGDAGQKSLIEQEREAAKRFLDGLDTERLTIDNDLIKNFGDRELFRELANNEINTQAGLQKNRLQEQVDRINASEEANKLNAATMANPVVMQRKAINDKMVKYYEDLIAKGGLEWEIGMPQGEPIAYNGSLTPEEMGFVNQYNNNLLIPKDEVLARYGSYKDGDVANLGNVDRETGNFYNTLADIGGLQQVDVSEKDRKAGKYDYDYAGLINFLDTIRGDVNNELGPRNPITGIVPTINGPALSNRPALTPTNKFLDFVRNLAWQGGEQ